METKYTAAEQWVIDREWLGPTPSPALFDVRQTPTHVWVVGSTRFDGVSSNSEESLAHRLNELPPPEIRKVAGVLADSAATLSAAQELLRDSGFAAIHRIEIAVLEHLAPDTLRIQEENGHACGAVPARPPSRALWRPSQGLLAALPEITRVLTQTKPPGQAATRWKALDVGAGSGRDAAYLAHLGWDVVCCDRDASLVAKAVRLGNRSDQAHSDVSTPRVADTAGCVTGVTRTLGAVLAEDAAWLRREASDLVVVVRFLRRGVLELLANGVRPSGLIFYEHFLVGCERFGGPVKRSQMLERSELATLFGPAKGFRILIDEESTLADGRPVIRFLAQKL